MAFILSVTNVAWYISMYVCVLYFYVGCMYVNRIHIILQSITVLVSSHVRKGGTTTYMHELSADGDDERGRYIRQQ